MIKLNFKKLEINISTKYIVLLIVLLGFLLRINNLTIGFPILFISNDEAIYHLSALNMIANKTFFTLGNYGPLGAYVQIPFLLIAFGVLLITGKITSAADMEFLLVTQEGYMIFIPRVISALFGTLSILVIYRITRDLYNNKRAALWASFLFSVSFNLVHVSHLARAWAPAIFFSLLSLLFAIKSVKETSREFKNTFLAIVFAALAFGFHQISGILVILILLIRLFGKQKYNIKLIFSRINYFAFSVWIFLILIFNYLSLSGKFFNIINPSNPNVGFLKIPQKATNIFEFVNYYLTTGFPERVFKDLILSDGLIFLFTLLFFLKKQNRTRLSVTVLIFIILNLLLITTIFPPFLRYALIAIALMPIFGGAFLSTINFKRWNMVIVLLVIILTSFNSVYWNILILHEGTFDQVRKWVEKDIDPKYPIIITSRRNFAWVPSASSSFIMRQFDDGYYLRASKFVDDNYFPNVRNIFDSSKLDNASKKEGVEKALKIYPAVFIVDWFFGDYDRLLNQDISHNLTLIAHFSPTPGYISKEKLPEALFDAPYNFPLFKVDRPGPYFDVLKVN